MMDYKIFPSSGFDGCVVAGRGRGRRREGEEGERKRGKVELTFSSVLAAAEHYFADVQREEEWESEGFMVVSFLEKKGTKREKKEKGDDGGEKEERIRSELK